MVVGGADWLISNLILTKSEKFDFFEFLKKIIFSDFVGNKSEINRYIIVTGSVEIEG